MPIAPAATPYEVAVAYCNDVHFSHGYDSARSAVDEYIEIAKNAIAHQDLPDRKVHIKQAFFTINNPDGSVRSTVDSGVFTCKHQA